LGGVLFDPIALFLNNAMVSRLVGFGLFGLATGAAIGFVESALKDRWLYVSAGPLAGKQFILYKPQTSIGSQQQCDIYLFKDSSILPQHAMLEARGNQMLLRAAAPVYVSGMPTQSRVLLSGDVIQIGRYTFRYNERLRQ
jgi:type III secretion system (T3SS) inner membrane Yop/YscD-like protein